MEIRNPRTLRLADPIAPARAPVRLRIDLGALADNWRDLARRAAPGRCAAVVKANAYGTGVSEAAPALWAAGAGAFFVADLNEGIGARGALPAAVRLRRRGGSDQSLRDPSRHPNEQARLRIPRPPARSDGEARGDQRGLL